jgi:osmotically-inducible protein OsmY
MGTLTAALAALTIASWACDNASDPSQRVAAALEHERIEGVDLEWEAEEGFLVLEGKVDSESVRSQAGLIAAQAAGRSATVVNALSIDGMDEDAVEDRDAEIQDQLTTLVEQDPQLREREIAVEVQNGVVTLKGDVQSNQERTKVEQLVRQLDGVRQVANGLQVVG